MTEHVHHSEGGPAPRSAAAVQIPNEKETIPQADAPLDETDLLIAATTALVHQDAATPLQETREEVAIVQDPERHLANLRPVTTIGADDHHLHDQTLVLHHDDHHRQCTLTDSLLCPALRHTTHGTNHDVRLLQIDTIPK
jgi:hypothetical protein